MATVEVECRAWQSHAIYRHGRASSGERRYRCKDCGHCFQLTYRYQVNEPGIGVRDTSRVLGISQNTAIRTLKNSIRRH